jgi:hypothetical protein
LLKSKGVTQDQFMADVQAAFQSVFGANSSSSTGLLINTSA